ncbi:FecR family protein [Candidatus Woesearchaeota archaeon]|nr:FecR family protein [Candidatus Woesearchaeota archaeon]
MKKNVKKQLRIWIPVAVVALLIIITLASVLGSSTRVAFLNVEDGDVQVNQGKGWKTAQDGMELDLGDAVRTGDGSAVVILYESVLVQLDPGTEVTIEELSKDNVKIRQESGSTWNKFAAIAGIKSFEVETPTTVATVRGTEFWVDLESVGVSEGKVDAEVDGQKMRVNGGYKAVVGNEEPVALTPEEIQRAMEKKQMVIRHLKKLREDELNKHPTIYNLAKKLRGWTDSDVRRYMDRMDNGEYDPEQIKKQARLPAKSVDKFASISKEIQEQNEQLKQLQQMRSLGPQPEPPDMPVRGGNAGIEGIDGESKDDPRGEDIYANRPVEYRPRLEPEEMMNPKTEQVMQGDQPEYDPAMQGDKPDY